MSVKIGYETLAERTGVTVTSAQPAATNPADNAVDWLPFDFYQPDAAGASIQLKLSHASAQSCDYIALAKHDLFTLGARVSVEYSADDATYSTALAATTLADDGVFFQSFTVQSAKYWRITFDRADAGVIQPSIGIMALGTAFDTSELPQIGFTPPLIDGDAGNTSISMDGTWLGKSIRKKALDMSFDFRLLSPAWVRTNWTPFMTHAQAKPFIISWDDVNYPSDAVMAWVEKKMPMPKYSDAAFNDVSLRLKAVLT